MIKMVSQFEDEKMRASVATPTCGPCCSCCCSCVVTTLVSSVITARNFGKIVERQAQEQALESQQIKEERKRAMWLGFFALPVSVAVFLWFLRYGVALDWPLKLAGLVVGKLKIPKEHHLWFDLFFVWLLFNVVYIFVLMFIRSRLRFKIPSRLLLMTFILSSIFILIEFIVWPYLIFSL